MTHPSLKIRLCAAMVLAAFVAAPAFAETKPPVEVAKSKAAAPPTAPRPQAKPAKPALVAKNARPVPNAPKVIPVPPPIPAPPAIIRLDGPELARIGLNAELGSLGAQVQLAQAYGGERGIDRNDVLAFAWLKIAAGRESIIAERDLGIKYLQVDGGTPDYPQALVWLQKAADRGSQAAQFHLGRMYAGGLGVPKDDVQAYKWLFLAANTKDPDMWGPDFAGEVKKVAARMTPAQIADGKAQAAAFAPGPSSLEDQVAAAWKRYNDGDHQGAFRTLSVLADQGVAHAQFLTANIYQTGEGAPRDLSAAFALYRKAAEQGHAGAQYKLGMAYLYGLGVEVDDWTAVNWVHRADAQGLSVAQERMGYFYLHGMGKLPVNPNMASSSFTSAAYQGDAAAQQEIGVDYFRGNGFRVDKVEGYKWILLSLAYTRDPDVTTASNQYLEEMKADMTPQQINDAERRARNWMPAIATP